MENLNDVGNTLAVDIITSVVSGSRREGLRIQTDAGVLLESGSVLQFDSCYTGVPMPRRLRVMNTTVMAMDVGLRSDRPGEVRYRGGLVLNQEIGDGGEYLSVRRARSYPLVASRPTKSACFFVLLYIRSPRRRLPCCVLNWTRSSLPRNTERS